MEYHVVRPPPPHIQGLDQIFAVILSRSCNVNVGTETSHAIQVLQTVRYDRGEGEEGGHWQDLPLLPVLVLVVG